MALEKHSLAIWRRSIVLILGTHEENRELYHSIKLLHPRQEGSITKVPAKDLKHFALQGSPALTSENPNEILIGVALEIIRLREEIKRMGLVDNDRKREIADLKAETSMRVYPTS